MTHKTNIFIGGDVYAEHHAGVISLYTIDAGSTRNLIAMDETGLERLVGFAMEFGILDRRVNPKDRRK
jgi:hypothetical protein